MPYTVIECDVCHSEETIPDKYSTQSTESTEPFQPESTEGNYLLIKPLDWDGWSRFDMSPDNIIGPDSWGIVRGWYTGVYSMPANMNLTVGHVVCNRCMMTHGTHIWTH